MSSATALAKKSVSQDIMTIPDPLSNEFRRVSERAAKADFPDRLHRIGPKSHAFCFPRSRVQWSGEYPAGGHMGQTFWQMSAAEIAGAVRAGQISATEIAQAHLEHMSQVNPKVNAVVQEFPEEALRAAGEVDAAIARGQDPGPLCGVPVTIKVNVDQQGHATTNGLASLKDAVADADSPVVTNIRKAGGVIVGRTNTPTLSLRWFTKNNVHGQTLNPRNQAI